jgi:hypothetical protein
MPVGEFRKGIISPLKNKALLIIFSIEVWIFHIIFIINV